MGQACMQQQVHQCTLVCVAMDDGSPGLGSASIPANIVANIGPADYKVNIRDQCVYCQICTCGWCRIDVHCVSINICHLYMNSTCSGTLNLHIDLTL